MRSVQGAPDDGFLRENLPLLTTAISYDCMPAGSALCIVGSFEDCLDIVWRDAGDPQ
mgnify:FL=1